MSSIVLTGLLGSHPLGAMASFGLLRMVSAEDREARLSFEERDDWVAVLHGSFTEPSALVALLTEASATIGTVVFDAFGDDDVRVPPERAHALVDDALRAGDLHTQKLAFLSALFADGARDNTKGLVKPTPFYMASGQQSFLDTMKRIARAVRGPEAWREALFGPWLYSHDEWGAGWDPGTERLHALRFKAPTKDKTSCVAGAVWLGFEALPLFPAFSSRGVVHSVGWNEQDGLDHFRWPIPTEPVSLQALSVLVGIDLLRERRANGRERHKLRRGIGAVYESTRHEFGQGYGVFRPARRLA